MEQARSVYLESIGSPKLYKDKDDYYFIFDGFKINLPLEYQDEEIFRFRKEFKVDPPRKRVIPTEWL